MPASFDGDVGRHRWVVFLALVLLVAASVGAALWLGQASDDTVALEHADLVLAVVDEDGAAVPGATVHADGYLRGRTDDGGLVGLKLSAGDHALEVQASTGAEDPPRFQVWRSTESAPRSDRVRAELQGWSSMGSVWRSLRDAASAAQSGSQGVSEITYSFVPAGVPVTRSGDPVTQTTLDSDGTVSYSAFKAEVRQAFGKWQELLEALVPRLRVNFVETAETGLPPPPMQAWYTNRSHGTGDIRIGIFEMESSNPTLAYAYGPGDNLIESGDILFNARVDWRTDADAADSGGDGGYSVMYVAAHEIGHALGLGHHANTSSLMAPLAGRWHSIGGNFGGSLLNSPFERNAVRGTFTVPQEF